MSNPTNEEIITAWHRACPNACAPSPDQLRAFVAELAARTAVETEETRQGCNWTPTAAEMAVIKQMAADRDISCETVIRQALRSHQMQLASKEDQPARLMQTMYVPRGESSLDWTWEHALSHAFQWLSKQAHRPYGVMVVSLHKGEDAKDYDAHYVQSGLAMSEMVSLLEFTKHSILRAMTFDPDKADEADNDPQ